MALPDGPKNPYGNGFIPVETDLTTELKAQRVCDPHKSRLWKIKNPNSLHPITGARRCAGPLLGPALGIGSLLGTLLCHEPARRISMG